MRIIQAAGWSGSGKTTLIQLLLERLRAEQVKAAVLKHHGKTAPLTLDQGKDTWNHRQAGAVETMVTGAGQSQWTAEAEVSLEEAVEFFYHRGVDMLLVEGWKHAHLPKIVLLPEHAEAPQWPDIVKIIRGSDMPVDELEEIMWKKSICFESWKNR
ncbi:molybdopterin-guanine dinucleotide biosynthesis protein B [Alkalicoccus chagannorensis]|uniref:molybdopterin-guanine dinucleotide biosynthesis protein B n=1 Tax=Alkalicoccus chagannorensis TaxID=427072 RepID=UPI0003FDA82F|nr:molybdopterin-guanine dinucleotide biosynthesis protein B [Alkalicoccus chagannorensis]